MPINSVPEPFEDLKGADGLLHTNTSPSLRMNEYVV